MGKSDLPRAMRALHPIIQAPMAGVSTPLLAAAVCEAGAIGSIGIGAMTVEAAREAIRRTREATAKPFNVNVFAHRPLASDPDVEARWAERLRPFFARYGAEPPLRLREIYPTFHGNDALLDMLCEERPGIVSFHFGCPDPAAVGRLKASGALLLASATNLAEAEALEAAGIDAMVAQGFAAGGHRGAFDDAAPDEALTLDALLARLVPALRVPVIAAGALMDGRDIARALDAGAAMAQLGTAFVACPESAAGDHYRARLREAGPEETRMTRTVSGRRARGLLTPFIEGLGAHEREAPVYPHAYDAHKQLAAAAEAAGDPALAAMWAGTGAHRSRALPAAALVERLAQELAEARRAPYSAAP